MHIEPHTSIRRPVPDGLRRVSVDLDMPPALFEALHDACLRRGLSLDRMVFAALIVAASAA
jgi:hypothetical protein